MSPVYFGIDESKTGIRGNVVVALCATRDPSLVEIAPSLVWIKKGPYHPNPFILDTSFVYITQELTNYQPSKHTLRKLLASAAERFTSNGDKIHVFCNGTPKEFPNGFNRASQLTFVERGDQKVQLLHDADTIATLARFKLYSQESQRGIEILSALRSKRPDLDKILENARIH